MATATKDVVDNNYLDQIEHIIETLDSADFLGEPTIHPITKKFVTDVEYDRLYGKNGSERAILKKNRPDSKTFKDVNSVNVDLSKATKVVHKPPLTSIDKADGTIVQKYKRLGDFMLDCLSRMNITVKISKDVFKTDGDKDHPKFISDIKDVEKALAELSETKDANGHVVFVQSLKHDGCAVSLYYKNSKLVQAGNRPRDGVNAASVLSHTQYITGIPKSLLVPGLDIVIRGEVEQKISDFEKYNKTAKEKGEKTYENARNSTAGAMNALGDPAVAGKRKLQFTGYSILEYDAAPYKTAMERAIWANKTLKTPFIRINPFKFSELERIANEVRSTLDYMIDGIIIEVNDLAAAEGMGNQGDRATGDPRAKLAWKFDAERAKVIVEKMGFEMNRTGKLSVVALFPTGARLAGTTVRRCTIHNVRQMIDGGVGIGAEILIYKAGEIIPYWEDTIKSAPQVNIPTNCPSCNSKLEWSLSKVDLLCNNDLCPARHIDRLVHYLKSFGVKGISDSTVNTLVGLGIVHNFADFYILDVAKLMKDAGYSEREAILDYARIHMVDAPEQEKDNARLLSKAQRAAASKKTISLAKFFAALGVPGAGKGTGTALAAEFGSIENIRTATVAQLEKCQDVGTKTAESISGWFSKYAKVIDDLLTYVAIEKPKTGIFSGKNFCFSGSFTPDKETWIARVEDEGAKVTTTPSKKTNYFVHGPGSGNKKDAAEKLKKDGIPVEIIEIEDLEKLMGLDKDDERLF